MELLIGTLIIVASLIALVKIFDMESFLYGNEGGTS